MIFLIAFLGAPPTKIKERVLSFLNTSHKREAASIAPILKRRRCARPDQVSKETDRKLPFHFCGEEPTLWDAAQTNTLKQMCKKENCFSFLCNLRKRTCACSRGRNKTKFTFWQTRERNAQPSIFQNLHRVYANRSILLHSTQGISGTSSSRGRSGICTRPGIWCLVPGRPSKTRSRPEGRTRVPRAQTRVLRKTAGF